MSGTATLVACPPASTSGAVWKIYKLDPPMEYAYYDSGSGGYATATTEHVVVSATTVPYTGAETYIFPSDGRDVIDWSELSGSYRGGLDHERALDAAGYSVHP